MSDHVMEVATERPVTKEDEAFIYSSWLNAMRLHCATFKHCPDRIFFSRASAMIERLIADKHVIIVCAKDAPTQILAYLVYDQTDEPVVNTVYFAYTKKPFRRLGIQKYLIGRYLGRDPIQYVFRSNQESAVGLTQRFEAVYNPFVLFKKGEV